MDPLLVAAYSATAPGPLTRTRKAEDAFYRRHGGRFFRRAFAAAPAVVVATAVVVVAGLIGQ